MAQLAQLLEVGGGERHAQRIELLVSIAHEHRDQVFQVLGDHDLVVFFVHGAGL